jgi:phage gp37-like protein
MAKEHGIFLIAGLVLVVCAVILAGCVQDNGTPAQVTTGGQPRVPAGTPSRYSGQGVHPNLTAAAEKLGVTQQQLGAALNLTSQGRMNLTQAAQQLGVTTQQLADALGFQFNASRQRPYPGATPQ